MSRSVKKTNHCDEDPDIAFTLQVKFGIESICIDSWAKKRQYDSLCKALSSGMNTHLQVTIPIPGN